MTKRSKKRGKVAVTVKKKVTGGRKKGQERTVRDDQRDLPFVEGEHFGSVTVGARHKQNKGYESVETYVSVTLPVALEGPFRADAPFDEYPVRMGIKECDRIAGEELERLSYELGGLLGDD